MKIKSVFNSTASLCLVFALLFCVFSFTGCSKINADNVTGDPESTTSADFDIDIGLLSLKFPSKWKDVLRVNTDIDGTIGIAEFYGRIYGHEEQLLFTLYINQDGEIPIGTVERDGKNLNLSCDFSELDFDESWTQSDIDMLCAMQEDINYIIDELRKDPTFIQ